MSKQRGFSLIELLIVVAIILIIAAIAIPNLMRTRMAANEAGRRLPWFSPNSFLSLLLHGFGASAFARNA